HLATRASDLARLIGQRALFLAVGFSALGVGFAFSQASRGGQALAAGASGLAGIGALTAALVLTLVVVLGQAPEGDATAVEAQARIETRLATIFCIAGALAAGVEGGLQRGCQVAPLSVGAG